MKFAILTALMIVGNSAFALTGGGETGSMNIPARSDLKSVHEGRVSAIHATEKNKTIEALIARSNEGQRQIDLKLAVSKNRFVNDVSTELKVAVAGIQLDQQKNSSLSFYTLFEGGVTCSNVILANLKSEARAYAQCTDGLREFAIIKRY